MYRVDIANKGNSVFEVKSKDYAFIIDTKGSGITPPDTLLASLGSCVGVYLRKYFEGAKLNVDKFNIAVQAELSHEAPVCFKSIEVMIDLCGVKLDERRTASLLEFIKNCPVHNTLESKPVVDVKLS